mgnify:CR=1 FL=1
MKNPIVVKETATIDEEYVDFLTPMREERNKRFKKFKGAWKKDGELYEDRNEYLRSLPKDEHGFPIVNHEEFDELASEYQWDMEFINEWVIDQGYVCAQDYGEYYTVTD